MKSTKNNNNEIIVVILSIIFSIITGILTKDLLLGGSTLLTGLLCAYYAGKGNKFNYILGLINYILMGYISFKNSLYGLFVFDVLIFAPLQIKGYIDWKKNHNEDSSVKVRQFTLKNSIIITLSCIVGSFVIGYLLSLIPGQRLALLDASSNCVNLCGIILMVLRFKESWWVWLVNNIIDLAIWIITAIQHGDNSMMMLLVSIGYLLINIWGIYKWNKEAKNNKMEG